jgi:hypothetical protein
MSGSSNSVVRAVRPFLTSSVEGGVLVVDDGSDLSLAISRADALGLPIRLSPGTFTTTADTLSFTGRPIVGSGRSATTVTANFAAVDGDTLLELADLTLTPKVAATSTIIARTDAAGTFAAGLSVVLTDVTIRGAYVGTQAIDIASSTGEAASLATHGDCVIENTGNTNLAVVMAVTGADSVNCSVTVSDTLTVSSPAAMVTITISEVCPVVIDVLSLRNVTVVLVNDHEDAGFSARAITATYTVDMGGTFRTIDCGSNLANCEIQVMQVKVLNSGTDDVIPIDTTDNVDLTAEGVTIFIPNTVCLGSSGAVSAPAITAPDFTVSGEADSGAVN